MPLRPPRRVYHCLEGLTRCVDVDVNAPASQKTTSETHAVLPVLYTSAWITRSLFKRMKDFTVLHFNCALWAEDRYLT